MRADFSVYVLQRRYILIAVLPLFSHFNAVLGFAYLEFQVCTESGLVFLIDFWRFVQEQRDALLCLDAMRLGSKILQRCAMFILEIL